MAGGRDESPDGLRRRLYAPGATEEDVEAYRTVAGHQPEPASPQPLPAPTSTPARRRRTGLLAAGGVLLVVVVATAGIAVAGGRVAGPVPTGTARAVAVPVQTTLPIAVSARLEFVRNLEAGRLAGLLPFFLNTPAARPTAIRTVGRAASDEFRGVGAGTIALEPSALAARRGRMTVLLVVDTVDGFEWRATRLAQTNDRSGPEVPVARRAGVLQPGEVGTTTITYRGGAPTSLQVLVGPGVRWGAVVVFTD